MGLFFAEIAERMRTKRLIIGDNAIELPIKACLEDLMLGYKGRITIFTETGKDAK